MLVEGTQVFVEGTDESLFRKGLEGDSNTTKLSGWVAGGQTLMFKKGWL